MNIFTVSTRHGTLLTCDGSTYSLTLDPDGHLLLDGQIASPVIESSTHTPLTLVTSTMMVCCTPEAFWRAFAGADAEPNMEETGYWFAQTLLRQEQLVQWKIRFEGVMQQMTEMLAPALPLITLPQLRLDAFTEACLAHCDSRPTVAQVQALATLLQQPVEIVTRWLEERGKHVPTSPAVPTRSDAAPSVQQESYEQAQEVQPEVFVPETPEQTEEVSIAPSSVQAEVATMTAPTSTRSASARAKPGQFKWTDERIAQLQASFLALPVSAQSSRRAAAITIARKHDWPLQSVLYKLYALYPLPTDEAEPGVEVVERGAFLWDVQVTREGESVRRERWELHYPLGSFPYAVQSIVKYRGQRYEVQQAHVNLLVMRLIEQTTTMPEAEMPPTRHAVLEPVGA